MDNIKHYTSIYKWSEMGNFIVIETTMASIDRLGMPSGFAYSRSDALDLQIKKLEAQRTEINLKINWMIEVVKRGIIEPSRKVGICDCTINTANSPNNPKDCPLHGRRSYSWLS